MPRPTSAMDTHRATTDFSSSGCRVLLKGPSRRHARGLNSESSLRALFQPSTESSDSTARATLPLSLPIALPAVQYLMPLLSDIVCISTRMEKKMQELTVPDYYNVLSRRKTCQISGLLLTKEEIWMLIKHTIPFKEHVNTLIANSLVGTADRKTL